ncbi:MAG: glycosyltransferase, partial [Planctomycetota bacterium]
MARDVIKDDSLVIIKNPVNCGKGYSVKKGILASRGEVILFSDADLSTPIEELDRMLPWVEKGYDIVIGSRALPESVIAVHQRWYRENMGK